MTVGAYTRYSTFCIYFVDKRLFHGKNVFGQLPLQTPRLHCFPNDYYLLRPHCHPPLRAHWTARQCTNQLSRRREEIVREYYISLTCEEKEERLMPLGRARVLMRRVDKSGKYLCLLCQSRLNFSVFSENWISGMLFWEIQCRGKGMTMNKSAISRIT